jgi:ribonuclease HI
MTTFKRGYIWRVGDGEKINIYTDPWIPSSPDRKIMIPRGDSIYTKVVDLIIPNSGTWNEERLNELFNIVDVNRILEIPLNNQGFEDFIAWNFTKHGQYAVRSGYHLQWRHQFGPRTSQLSLPGSSVNNPIWKIIWNLKVPSKVKIFVWRALHGILPLKSILANRHVGTNGGCPICNQAAEDVLHLVFTCPTARSLWCSLGISQSMEEALEEDRSGSAVLEFLFRRQDTSMPGIDLGMKEVIAVGSWYLWWIRRQRTHDEQVPPMFKCKFSILSIAANAAKAQSKTTTQRVRWSRPPPRITKVNVDGSFHSDSHTGSVGAILRDYEGKFVAASSIYLPNIASAAAAEALAMKEGLDLASRLGCNNIQIESDSLDTVEACTGEATWWGQSSAIFADCVDLAALIGGVQFQYCPREANEAAHDLVRACFSSKVSCNWVDEPPDFILGRLLNDVTIL